MPGWSDSNSDMRKEIPGLALRHFALDFAFKQSMHGGHGTPSLTGSLLSPRQRHLASAGFPVVAARYCADPLEEEF